MREKLSSNQQGWLLIVVFFSINFALTVESDLEPALAGNPGSIGKMIFYGGMVVLALIVFVTDFQIGE